MLGSAYGAYRPRGRRTTARRARDSYTIGDSILYELDEDGARRILHGRRSRSARRVASMRSSGSAGRTAPPAGRESCSARASSRTRVAGVPRPRPAGEIEPVAVEGLVHEGAGELEDLLHLEGDRYAAIYNIDGCSWAYEMRSTSRAAPAGRARPRRPGRARGRHPPRPLTSTRRAARSRSRTAPRPTRPSLGARAGRERAPTKDQRARARPRARAPRRRRGRVVRVARRAPRLGAALPPVTRARARGPRPLVYYVHGGPQSQERPNFAWFSMPLVQSLALEGFAVFVPQRARLVRVRARVHEARRPRLGRPRPARPRARDDRGAAARRSRRRVPGRRRDACMAGT